MDPVPMILFCPNCNAQHVDTPSEGWDNPPHRSHKCHVCHSIWRPCDIPTRGVRHIATRGELDTHSFNS